MKRKLAVLTAPVLFAIALIRPCELRTAAAPKAEDDFQIVKVADGVYAAIAKSGGLASGNAGFVVGDEGLLNVDTFFTPVAIEELISEMGKISPLPIKYAVNTH